MHAFKMRPFGFSLIAQSFLHKVLIDMKHINLEILSCYPANVCVFERVGNYCSKTGFGFTFYTNMLAAERTGEVTKWLTPFVIN